MASGKQMETDMFSQEPKAGGRRGPPNRMNDLSYTEWMRFQKSFSRHRDDVLLVEEMIRFFTKETWVDGSVSKSVVFGDTQGKLQGLGQRTVEEHTPPCELKELVHELERAATVAGGSDFVLVDLRKVVTTREATVEFVDKYGARFYKALAKLMAPDRYCSVLARPEGPGGCGFPIPWAIAAASRCYVRLRDEKVVLQESDGNVFYVLTFQAMPDGRTGSVISPATTEMDDLAQIGAWTLPKPPPRKPNELLHPAKYPETLVEEFIRRFTDEGDNVLDPMVGTGSTVLAALRSGRAGYGVDLVAEFVEIARARAGDATRQLTLDASRPEYLLIEGDAAVIDEIPELKDIVFDYVVTSPPYWSMLSNPGSENQRARRKRNLQLVYSDNERDIGNCADYDEFVRLLVEIYERAANLMRRGAYLTVVVKNVKRNHVLYPLAWDLMASLSRKGGRFKYSGNTLWCQDDVGMKPFAVGTHWVSNIVHNYCLHFVRT